MANKIQMSSNKIKKSSSGYKRYKQLRQHVKKPEITCQVVDNPEILLEAKRLHAEVYLDKKFILPEDLNDDGTINLSADPYQTHALYFATIRDQQVDKDKVLAIARQIYHAPSLGFDSFPVLKQTKIYQNFMKEILAINPEDCVEISALVKRPNASIAAPFLVYREMLYYSHIQKHKKWIMALDVRVYKHLKAFFGDSIEPIGEKASYQGGDVIPVRLLIKDSIKSAQNQIGVGGMVSKQFRKAALEMFTYDKSYRYDIEHEEVNDKTKNLGKS